MAMLKLSRKFKVGRAGKTRRIDTASSSRKDVEHGMCDGVGKMSQAKTRHGLRNGVGH